MHLSRKLLGAVTLSLASSSRAICASRSLRSHAASDSAAESADARRVSPLPSSCRISRSGPLASARAPESVNS